MRHAERPEWAALDCVPGDFDRLHWGHSTVTELGQLALILGGSVDSFTGDLLRLYAKADPGNRAKLVSAFPRECLAYDWWYHHDTEPTAQEVQDMLATIGPLAEMIGGKVIAVTRPTDMLMYGSGGQE